MKLGAVFEMIQGKMGLVLNSGLPFGRYFPPQEIADFLAHERSALSPTTIPAGTQETVGQPADYPATVLSALKGYQARGTRIRDILARSTFIWGRNTGPTRGARIPPGRE